MTRVALPNRRPAENRDIDFRGQRLTVTVGFDLDGCVREVFAVGPKEGSDMLHTIADACVVISIALQHGIAASDLVKSLGSVPDWNGTPAPASVIGAVLAIIAEVG
jgi:hypothetical protein